MTLLLLSVISVEVDIFTTATWVTFVDLGWFRNAV